MLKKKITLISKKSKKARGYGLNDWSSFGEFTKKIIHNQKIESPAGNLKMANSWNPL